MNVLFFNVYTQMFIISLNFIHKMGIYSLFTRNVHTFQGNVRKPGSHGSWLFSCLPLPLSDENMSGRSPNLPTGRGTPHGQVFIRKWQRLVYLAIFRPKITYLAPNSFLGLESKYFCYLGAHAKFQNFTTTPSGRMSKDRGETERKRERKKITSWG